MVKVDSVFDKVAGQVLLTFEANRDSDLVTLDAVRVAMMGDFPKVADVKRSNLLHITVQVPPEEAANW